MQDLNKEVLSSLLASLHEAIELAMCSESVVEDCDCKVSAMGQLVDAYETDYVRKTMALQDGLSQENGALIEELLATRAKLVDARARMTAAQEISMVETKHHLEDRAKVTELREQVRVMLALD
jgi:hypothetical protein